MALSHLNESYDMWWRRSHEGINKQSKGDKMFRNIVEKLQEKRNTPVEVAEHNSNIQKPVIHNNALDDMLNTQKEFEKNLLQLLEDVNEDEINKANKLNSLGFGQSINSRPIRDKNRDAEKSKLLSELSKYYENKYGLKYVSYDVCNSICKKHNLLKAHTDLYIGEVPDEAMHDIEEFKGVELNDLEPNFKDRISNDYYFRHNLSKEDVIERMKSKLYKDLMIIAPDKLLHNEGHIVVNYELVPKNLDPIVIQEVNQGYLIITAWGDEKKIVENL